MFITVIATMLLSGCGDDKKSSPSGPEVDPTDYHYSFAIASADGFEKDNAYLVMVESQDGTVIDSVELTVDNSTFVLEGYAGSYGGVITLPTASSYNFDLAINDEEFDVNLAIASTVDVDWPNELTMDDGNDLTWELTPDQDSDLQEFYFSAYDNGGDEEYHFKSLAPSARNYEIPGSWLNSSLTTIEIELIESNYVIDGELLAFSIGGEGMIYGSYGKKNMLKEDFLKGAVKKLSKSIK